MMLYKVTMKCILIDLDGVCADFNAGVMKQMVKLNPEWVLTLDDLDEFYLKDIYNRKFGEAAFLAAQDISNAEGFYANLEPIEGAKAALIAITAAGYDVAICTAPMFTNQYCEAEKRAWVKKHLGEYKTHVVVRKETIPGDLLFDDRATVNADNASWKHILFEEWTNRKHRPGRKTVNWSNYLEVIKEFLA